MKNLSGCNNVRDITEGGTIPEILRFAQDDIHISIKESIIIVTLYNVILNVVKNLSVCTNIESLTTIEILRSAQDDNVEC